MSKTFDQGREEIAKLCKYFATNRQAFFAPGVKEAHVRQSLIDPFFETLGWDMRNTAMVAPQYREVVTEDSLEIEGQQKAPDYTFRVGTLAKFYTEAKKCGININADPGPAYQLRRYGWSAKVPLSILTDFEELGVYDCSQRPRPVDKASYGRIQYFRSEEYPDRWRELWEIFSREAVWAGAYDKFAASKRKRGTSEVDSEFLKEIEGWRDSLARNIALRNLYLGYDDLNTAVQRTIDRLIFLRIAEDRGSESYGQLLKLCEQPEIYARFMKLCRKADEKYNSGIFHFQKEDGVSEQHDRLTPALTIDDKVIKPILQNLYFEHGSPYHFGVLPVEILGTVYERFLGKVIRLTPEHRAKVEEKPEVRKAGGVYYTPAYIVDYIVKNTVGKMIEGKSPAQLAGGKNGQPLRVLDMACGSGSFLLGAYQYLLDHCLKWYLENHPAKHKQAVYLDSRGKYWRLTIAEKKRILISHIFGVDIDLQAVEVSKLSLLLKVLEGETDETVGKSRQLFHERALPNLSNNIKCGNSLIGPDYFSGRLIPDPDEMKRVNPFDWQREFPDAMKSGGFDCVIGNPPYGAEFSKNTNEYLCKKYTTYVLRGESYLIFIERAINLLKHEGVFGYIIPDTYLNLGFTKTLRSLLLKETKIMEIVKLPSNVFSGATVDTTLLFFKKINAVSNYFETDVLIKEFEKKSIIQNIIKPNREIFINTKIWFEQNSFNISSDAGELEIISKIDKFKCLSFHAEMYSGIKAYEVGKGSPPQTTTIRDEKPFTSVKRKNSKWQQFYDGKHIGRYKLYWNNDSWINYGPWLAAPRDINNFEGEKILIRKIVGRTLLATYVPETSFCNTLLFVLKIINKSDISYLYLLGILNSELMGWYFRKKFQICAEDTFPQIMIRDILQFPIPGPGKAHYEYMVSHVQHMLDLNKQLPQLNTIQSKVILQRQIEITDGEIDKLVYELYGLSEKEIKIIES